MCICLYVYLFVFLFVCMDAHGLNAVYVACMCVYVCSVCSVAKCAAMSCNVI